MQQLLAASAGNSDDPRDGRAGICEGMNMATEKQYANETLEHIHVHYHAYQHPILRALESPSILILLTCSET